MSRKTWRELEPRRREGVISVEEETAPLREVYAWGPAGIEALLALYLPKETSLFLEEMDVVEAREEFEDLQATLEAGGAKVVRVRDLIARILDESGVCPISRTLEDLARLIREKALAYYGEFGLGDLSRLNEIDLMLAQDVQRYGERGAILLNELTCELGTGLMPMANIMFGRDQTTVVGNVFVWMNMRKPIRQPEVHIWQEALAESLDGVPQVVISGEGRMEGGDVYVSNGVCFVGVGGRTNLEGAKQLAPEVLRQGMRFVYVHSHLRDTGAKNPQPAMHLDTFSMPGPRNTMVVWEEEARERRVVEVFADGSEEEGGSFWDMLVEMGYDIITVSQRQQEAYVTNFVNLGNNRVLLTLGCNRDRSDHSLADQLRARGVEVIELEMRAVTQAYGGIHCSLAPKIRG